MQDLAEWLGAIGMAQYAPRFVAQKLDMDLLAKLSDGDLEKLGVSAFGDRLRLLKGISTSELRSRKTAATPRQGRRDSSASRSLHDWFTEGNEFCDLREAKVLLDALP
jgi:hypothetical protein